MHYLPYFIGITPSVAEYNSSCSNGPDEAVCLFAIVDATPSDVQNRSGFHSH